MKTITGYILLAASLFCILLFQNCGGKKFSVQVEQPRASLDLPYVPICRDVADPAVAPKLKWDWIQELSQSPDQQFLTFDQVMAAPMVADLDGDKKVEVVFVTFSKVAADWFPDRIGAHYRGNGVLRIVDGSNGQNKLSIGTSDLAPLGVQSPLLVDIDKDGKVEIIYMHYKSKKLIALNYDGSTRWVFDLPQTISMAATGFSASDVNNDGLIEVQVGSYLVSEDTNRVPKLVVQLTTPITAHYSTVSLALNSNEPLKTKVINHLGVFNVDGSAQFLYAHPGQYVAVADIFPDKMGLEVLVSGSAHIGIYNGITGEELSYVNISQYNDLLCPSGSAGGGPATIGDFDGDGTTLEIALATGRHLTLFDKELKPKYKVLTQDCSSRSTGLTSFDLNGDKKPEVLYADEEYFRIYEFSDGNMVERHKIINPSGTLHEYPVIADLNGDDTAEILVAANNYAASVFYKDPEEVADGAVAALVTGVRAFESAGDHAWMPTRPIWNQHSFHPDLFTDKAQWITGANTDGSFFRRNNQGYNLTRQCE